jgi:hypothetical protein
VDECKPLPPGIPRGSLPPSEGVMAIQAALQAAFPFADDLCTISTAEFTPHLSVGPCTGPPFGSP